MKILLAIDGSKCSEAAAESLIKNYRPEGVEVLVFHAVETTRLMPTTYGFGTGPVFAQDFLQIAEQWKTEGQKLVAGIAKRLQAAGFTASTAVEEGDARELVLDRAREWKPDLILVGSHGKKGIDRFLLGSVSEAVARHATCSVQIVRA